jgi:hypothetical protein
VVSSLGATRGRHRRGSERVAERRLTAFSHAVTMSSSNSYAYRRDSAPGANQLL